MKFVIEVVDDSTCIPASQVSLIRKAISYYLETSKKFNSVPTESESYEIFDMNVLMKLLEYPLSVSITEDQKESFTANHGVDFPLYMKG
jgi:hypothetical protein